ncbi:LacI family DNA-binding transcriptional regulator [Actibacterium sp. 188UL27-1]|uniref:LacI family DNA-binding transcriptional regulator n=1 Tax=Actibacterium sp. 188UL27-1 TaxID=2786961 RepID=UPI00195EDD4C|nr:LacI family DNA-binding transcriptional regulator [Actibacterium sp. 188UL27-1]MBM7069421.1 LacI family DNA-binding transcriptional regulator [Actibacterium sp. 188UL27-1]
MRDVAQKAGVSIATVSRVLSGTHNVAPETRRAVEQAIADLNFVPSAAARSINSGRTHMVGALVPTLDYAIFARFLDTLELELAKAGLSLVVATTKNDPDQEAKRAGDLLNLGVEGLVVSGITRSAEFEALVTRHALPVVATSYFDPESDLPTIGYDNAAVARVAFAHLADLGHREIAVLSGPARNNDRTRTRVNTLRARDDARISFHETELNHSAAGDQTEQILAQRPNVTAILCMSDVLAQGALFRLQTLGIAVPDQLSLMGVDDLQSSACTYPPLTSVHLPVEEMGHKTATAMARWVAQGIPAKHEKLPSSISIRRSTQRLG